ncbi:LysE family translocator [Acinetobacter shaoyimingii]|uniref:LysE family translocator n=1 Tax=Acinetobacter shaoyimingii TaxID=2715164 RepID=A0A6G8RU69_9GAMM|nr:LysE family translocator [Acinetobacter shaoyimingii]QIO05482.1 LysE family translocator [Acinetobacter shaoyimingii]
MFSQIGLYIFSLGLAALIPGPGMTGLLFKTLSQNSKQAFLMLMGLITGDLIYLLFSIFGINLILKIYSSFFNFVLILSALYLIYLSCQFWLYDYSNALASTTKSSKNHKFSSYYEGLRLTLSNPKTISFYLALVPAIFSVHQKIPAHLFVLILISTVFTLIIVGAAYIIFATKLKSKLHNPRVLHIVFKLTAIFMFGLAIKLLNQL